MNRFFKSQLTFLLYGLVFWFPVALMLYILCFIFSSAEGVGDAFLRLVLPGSYVHTGFGIILFILIIYFSGFMLKSTKIRGILSRIPVVGLFFGQGEIISINKLLHMQPCLFLYSPTCISYGWILSEEKVQIGQKKAGFPLVSVYYPNVPTMVTGSVFINRKDSVMKLGNPSTEVINLLLYAFRSPPSLLHLPWEAESREEFEKRSELFGLKENPVALPRVTNT